MCVVHLCELRYLAGKYVGAGGLFYHKVSNTNSDNENKKFKFNESGNFLEFGEERQVRNVRDWTATVG